MIIPIIAGAVLLAFGQPLGLVIMFACAWITVDILFKRVK